MAAMTPEEIDRAMKVYLGMNESGGIKPFGEKERLVAEYGRLRACSMAGTLQGYLDDMMAMPLDWKEDTLDSASDRAALVAEELVPGLSPLTYKAMSNYFNYQWR